MNTIRAGQSGELSRAEAQKRKAKAGQGHMGAADIIARAGDGELESEQLWVVECGAGETDG